MITYNLVNLKQILNIKLTSEQNTKRNFTELCILLTPARSTDYAFSKETSCSDAKQTIQAWSCDNGTGRTCQWNIFKETYEVIRLNMVHSRM